MSFDIGGFQLTSGALGLVLYGAASLFVTGQLIGDREAQKLGWNKICRSEIRAKIERDKPVAPARLPSLCGMIFGMHGAQGEAYCDMHGHVFDGPLNAMNDAVRRQKQELHNKRMSYASGRAGSRCDCAVTVTLEKRRVPLALYAGSLRIVMPPSVKALRSELKTALNSEHCAEKR